MIKASQLTLQLSGQTILDGIDLTIEPNEWVYLLGPSGSGKTTLLRALAGLIKVDAGSIIPNSAAIAYLPQEPSLWPHLTASANVALGLDAAPLSRTEKRAAAAHWLDAVGAGHLASKFPDEISGGEARRVELARVLASGAKLMLLDEPMAHLDLHHAAEIHHLLREAHRRHSLTTLCVMHEVSPPMHPDDRTVILTSGRIIHDAPLRILDPDTGKDPFLAAVAKAASRLGQG